MRILIIGNPTESSNSYTSMWYRFLPEALVTLGAKLMWFRRFNPKNDNETQWVLELLAAAREADHILAPGVRYLSTISREACDYLHSHFNGLIGQICDGSLLDNSPVDINFTVRDDLWRYQDNPGRLMRHLNYNKYIGWAADKALFYPEKNDDKVLRIFVDHANFDCKFDYTLTLLMNIASGREIIKKAGYSDIEVQTLTDEGIVDIDLDNIRVRPFRRTHVPVEHFSAALRRADIFAVTHQESLGLSVLEAAMCGALIISPSGTISPDRLACVDHIIMSQPLNWLDIIPLLDKDRSATRVSGETWEVVAQRILEGFDTWRKR